jgi:flagellar biosynthesis GTPase FlhF
MPTPGNGRPSADGRPTVIAAPTLKAAHKRVRERFGDNAVILDTRTVTERQPHGLGQVRRVEIVVQPAGTPVVARPAPRPAPAAATTDAVPADLLREVERIESLVEAVVAEYGSAAQSGPWLGGNPAAEALLAGGAAIDTVRKTLTRFAGETGSDDDDRAGVLAWLGDNLGASNCGWDGFFGCHAFLGESGAGRTELVLAAARRLHALGRRVLILSLLPAHGGEIRRLQSAAAEIGCDAAVIKRAEQLAASDKHLAAYDVVLLDMPRLDHPALAVGGAVHAWLAGHTGFHRHLLAPLDRDLTDIEPLQQAARDWNCDWTAVTRLDRTRRRGKVLDLTEAIPLPVSLLASDPGVQGGLDIATTEILMDLILTAAPAGSLRAAAG